MTSKNPNKKPIEEEKEELTLEQVQQAAAMAIGNYFTPDLNARINEMTDSQMVDALGLLEESPFWIAILKYNNHRLLMAQTTINSLDPNVQATAMARTQGIMTGLIDLQNVVISLVTTKTQMENEAEEMRHVT